MIFSTFGTSYQPNRFYEEVIVFDLRGYFNRLFLAIPKYDVKNPTQLSIC